MAKKKKSAALQRGKKGKQGKSAWERFSSWTQTVAAKCALVYFIGFLILCGLVCVVSAPERYSLEVGQISRQTINATKDVVDEITTEEMRKAAAAAVNATYKLQEGISDEVLTKLEAVFGELRTVQQYGMTLREEGDDAETMRTRSFSDEEIEYAQKLVTSFTLGRYQATTLLRTDTADFDTMVNTVTTAVSNSLNAGIREGRVSDAISTLQQIVGYRVDISLVQNVLPTVLRTCLQPNLVIDQETTQADRQRAMEAVDSVVYLQGQCIIREGDIVRQNQYEMVKSLGLLADNHYDITVYVGAVVLVALCMSVMLLALSLTARDTLHDLRRSCVVISVMIVALGLCAAMVKVFNVYLAPVALGAMLLTATVGWHVSVPVTMCLAVMQAGLAAGNSTTSLVEMLYMLLMGLLGGLVSVRFLKTKPQRLRVLVCGALVAFVNAVIVVALGLMNSLHILDDSGNTLWAAAGGLLSGVIAVGLQPVVESVFNLATPGKLLELGNPNHPLLRRLLLEAPGTYHHSIIVANLAEAATEAVGGNPLLARTGAYFHDVGKLKRPQYFKENQSGENPLNMTDPYVSASIVTAHTRDGVQLAQKYRLPPEVQQIIAEHHGDTPVMFFYHKALQLANGSPIDIADFRYDGPRPTTREAAIVMMADTVEAAVRSMPDPTPESIRENIERLVRGKIEDGQLSDCPLSLRDIDRACEAFAKVLNGVFHERIEYPKAEVPKRGAFRGIEGEPAEAAQAKAAPKTEAPKPAAPKTDAPQNAEAPKPAAPKTDAPQSAEAPKPAAPKTDVPQNAEGDNAHEDPVADGSAG